MWAQPACWWFGWAQRGHWMLGIPSGSCKWKAFELGCDVDAVYRVATILGRSWDLITSLNPLVLGRAWGYAGSTFWLLVPAGSSGSDWGYSSWLRVIFSLTRGVVARERVWDSVLSLHSVSAPYQLSGTLLTSTEPGFLLFKEGMAISPSNSCLDIQWDNLGNGSGIKNY